MNPRSLFYHDGIPFLNRKEDLLPDLLYHRSIMPVFVIFASSHRSADSGLFALQDLDQRLVLIGHAFGT